MSFEDEGAPQYLKTVAENISSGTDEYYNGIVALVDNKVKPIKAMQAFMLLAREVVLLSYDAYLLTPLQLIAKLEKDYEQDDNLNVDHLFIRDMYIHGTVCPFTPRERQRMKDFLVYRLFKDKTTNVLCFGEWKRQTWYDFVLMSTFSNHMEVNIDV
jgi:hypothetical protein